MKRIVILITVFALILTSVVYGAGKSFTDVKEKDWFYEALNNVVDRGIIDGYPDGTFKPQENISRAEFTKVIVAALGLDTVEGNAFVDTEKHWAKDVINTAIENHIIDRTEYGYSYIPDEKITRIEMAKMVVRALGFEKDAEGKAGKKTKFIDNFAIKDADKGYVVIASENGVVNGYTNNTFQPNGKATRAEAAQMLVNMLKVIESSVVEVPVDGGVTDAGKMDSIPIENTNYDYLKEYLLKDLRGNIKYEVESIISADKSLFPIKFGNIVVTGIEKLESESAPYDGDTSFYWKGADGKDAIVVHAYAINENDITGVTNGYWLNGLELGVARNDSGFNISTIATIAETDTIYKKTKELFNDYAFGEHPKVSLNKEFSTMFILNKDVKLSDIDKLILLDTMDSVREGLEFDIDKID